MILETLKNDLKDAMKARDQLKVSTLRFLLGQIQNRQIALQAQGLEITDEEVISVLRRQVKERKESIEAFKKGMREDLVRKEEAELEILSKYLPKQLGDDELKKIVEEMVQQMGASSASDFGKVMGLVMGKVKGKADGNIVAKVVKEALASNV